MRATLADVLVAAVIAGAGVGALEAVIVGHGLGLVLTIVGLHVGLGLAVGAAMLASESAVARLRLGGAFAAAVRAAPALLVFVPVAATLFEGGKASTLPGAASAPVWFPAAGWFAVAAAVWLGQRARAGRLLVAPPVARWISVAACGLLLVVAELANRLLFPSEYPRVHAMLVVVSCVALALVLRLSLAGERTLSGRRRALAALAAAAVAAAAIGLGLRGEEARWAVATHGNHARHLANTARALLDFDRDGYAAVLGGGDCDDGDRTINPGAVDHPGNQRDEDCDGVDAEVVEAAPEHWDQPAADAAARSALLERTAGMNLLLLSVDALRADVVSDRARAAAEFPALARLLDDSRYFTRALAPASGTDVSLASLLTGLHDPFVPVDTTLFEALSARGARVHAVLPREVLRWAPRTLLERGVATSDEVINDRRKANIGDHSTTAETTDRGVAAMRAVEPGQRFALWLHYFDVHEHLQLSPGDPDLVAIGADLSTTEGKYRALLAVVDRGIDRVLGELEARGLADSTVVVLLSDHGESLGEDARLPQNHGKFVYRALTEIPLAIRIPGVDGARIDEPVSLIDVLPTLADLFALEVANRGDGESLVPHLVGSVSAEPRFPGRALVTRDSHQWAVIEWPYKLMYRPDDNLYELYHLERDPTEQHNLVDDEARVVRRLKQLYQRFPEVSFDRTRQGRRWREAQARPPPRR